jgi:cyclic pyranopterin monophosphate synthase
MSTPSETSSNEDNLGNTPNHAMTHVDASGRARMVDIGGKSQSKRIAIACSRVVMSPVAANAIRENTIAKGDCLQVARIAAIQGAKQTSHLIPLCHVVLIDSVDVTHRWVSDTELEWQVSVGSTGATGVEMEALMAASVAALTVYDMCKAIDRTMTISKITLLSKSGGARGDYKRKE